MIRSFRLRLHLDAYRIDGDVRKIHAEGRMPERVRGCCLYVGVCVGVSAVIFYNDAMTTTQMWRRYFRASWKNGHILPELLKWAQTAANRVVNAMAANWRTAKFKMCSRVLHVSTICAEQRAHGMASWQIVKWASPLADDRKIKNTADAFTCDSCEENKTHIWQNNRLLLASVFDERPQPDGVHRHGCETTVNGAEVDGVHEV